MLTAATDLMAAILADPFADGPRLVFADWLDERGETERAEFIRLQIAFSADRERDVSHRLSQLIDNLQMPAKMLGIGPDWTWSGDCESAIVTPNDGNGIAYTFQRGFPSRIECSLEAFMGGPCDCRSFTSFVTDMLDGINPAVRIRDCPACRGTGRVPGLVDTLGAKWPITEVRLGEVEPLETDSGKFFFTEGYGLAAFAINLTSSLPKVLSDRVNTKRMGCTMFPSSPAALAALSSAAVALMRERAGLGELVTAPAPR